MFYCFAWHDKNLKADGRFVSGWQLHFILKDSTEKNRAFDRLQELVNW